MQAYSADAIANYFVDRGKSLTQIKVQKLCFYAHGWYLALDPSGRPLIGEQVEAWKYGPVFRSLYREFAEFGNRPIDRKARELKINKTEEGVRFQLTEPDIESESPTDVDTELAEGVLGRGWEIYGGFTSYQLSNMTHAEGEPWRIIRDAMPDPLPRGLHIPNETIRECFQEKLAQAQ